MQLSVFTIMCLMLLPVLVDYPDNTELDKVKEALLWIYYMVDLSFKIQSWLTFGLLAFISVIIYFTNCQECCVLYWDFEAFGKPNDETNSK